MRTFLIHLRIGLQESLRAPFALAVLLFTGLTTLVYWPGLTDPSGAGGEGDAETGDEAPGSPGAVSITPGFTAAPARCSDNAASGTGFATVGEAARVD